MALADFAGGVQDALRQLVADRMLRMKMEQDQKMADARLQMERTDRQLQRERYGVEDAATARREAREQARHAADLEERRQRARAAEEHRLLGPEIARQEKEREQAVRAQEATIAHERRKELEQIQQRGAFRLAQAAREGRVDEKPSQGEYTSAGYAGRMEQAEEPLRALEQDTAGMNIASYELQRRLPAAFQSADMQSYNQAASNFINAVLRRESGAVISPSEFNEARKQYLPQPGDTKETLTQKRQNRQYVFETMKRGGGRAYQAPVKSPTTFSPDSPPPAPSGWKYVPKPGGGWTAVEDR